MWIWVHPPVTMARRNICRVDEDVACNQLDGFVPVIQHGWDSFTGWWARATPLKNMKVNWDDEIPFIYGTIKNGNQTTNQINIFETQQI